MWRRVVLSVVDAKISEDLASGWYKSFNNLSTKAAYSSEMLEPLYRSTSIPGERNLKPESLRSLKTHQSICFCTNKRLIRSQESAGTIHRLEAKLLAAAEMISVDISNYELSTWYQYLQTPTGLHHAIFIANKCSLIAGMGSNGWINLAHNRISDGHLWTWKSPFWFLGGGEFLNL